MITFQMIDKSYKYQRPDGNEVESISKSISRSVCFILRKFYEKFFEACNYEGT